MKQKRLLLLLTTSFTVLFTAMAQVGSTPNPATKNPRVGTNKPTASDSVEVKPNNQEANSVPSNKAGKALLASATAVIMIPQNDFAQKADALIGAGLDITVMPNLAKGRLPLEWDKRWVNVYAGGYFQYIYQDGTSDSYTNKDLYYETEVTSRVHNNMFGLGLASRIEFFPKPFRLFIEGSTGIRVLNGFHTIEVETIPIGSVDPETNSRTNYLNGTILTNYAYGGGMRIGNTNCFELKVVWVNGGPAQYVDIESVKFNRNNNTIEFNTIKSRTDMLLVHLGISRRF